ncbi:RNA polymerase sigma factor [Luethyella okanaganae]|uniref:RNA polymerase sigma factor n=1 Tax=Luethyella okanaganae TaxID=69372 RepID=A0ABW1VC49_9MICO
MDPEHAQPNAAPSGDAFALFYGSNYELLLSVAQQRLSGLADAEDVTHETFRVAWMHHLEGNELTLSWIYRVLRNIIGNEYQRLVRSEQLRQQVLPLYVEQVLSIDDDDALEVRRCMNDLREEDRELLFMAYWEDLTRHEMAEILGTSVVSVRVRLLRARRALEAWLSKACEQQLTRYEGGE